MTLHWRQLRDDVISCQVTSESETDEAGGALGRLLGAGDVVALIGDLGAGKTRFVKGVAEAWGVFRDDVNSPTFTLMNIYPVKSQSTKYLVHIDTYRLKDEQELNDIGIEDYLGRPEAICLIEWPEKIKKLLKNKKTLKIKIKHRNNGREITF